MVKDPSFLFDNYVLSLIKYLLFISGSSLAKSMVATVDEVEDQVSDSNIEMSVTTMVPQTPIATISRPNNMRLYQAF